MSRVFIVVLLFSQLGATTVSAQKVSVSSFPIPPCG